MILFGLDKSTLQVYEKSNFKFRNVDPKFVFNDLKNPPVQIGRAHV